MYNFLKNEHFDLVGDITFQSLIGNVQLNTGSTKTRKLKFQSLIGNVQPRIVDDFNDFDILVFQSLIGNVQLYT